MYEQLIVVVLTSLQRNHLKKYHIHYLLDRVLGQDQKRYQFLDWVLDQDCKHDHLLDQVSKWILNGNH